RMAVCGRGSWDGINNLCRVAHDSRIGWKIACDQGTGFDNGSRANGHSLEDGGVWADPDVVTDGHGLSGDGRPRPAFAEGRTGDRIGNAFRRRQRVEIGVGNSRIPADYDVVADAQFQFTQEQGIREKAVVADLDASVASDGEVNAIHRAMR